MPGGIGSIGGFIPYYNQYFVDDPFTNYTGPRAGARGDHISTLPCRLAKALMLNGWRFGIELDGNAADDLDSMRIFLVSPEGTQSELNNFYGDTSFLPSFTTQPSSAPPAFINPVGDISSSDSFLWTFSTNRNWGESTNSEVIIHPATGEPLLADLRRSKCSNLPQLGIAHRKLVE